MASGFVVNVHPGQQDSVSLKVQESDSLTTLKEKIAHKLGLEAEPARLTLRYQEHKLFYTLGDDEDYDILIDRQKKANRTEFNLWAEGAGIGSPAPANGVANADSKVTHHAAPSESGHSSHPPGATKPASRAGSVKSSGTHKTSATQKTSASGKKVHEDFFDNFQAQQYVKTFLGSIGPVKNVRMMIKRGFRDVYMSRSFALANGFIPKDAAPGWYGFNGITNLGKWPIKVGEKGEPIEHTVMLAERAYFDIILGRSWMERMGVHVDPLDKDSITLNSTGERIQCDLVVVKDESGRPITGI